MKTKIKSLVLVLLMLASLAGIGGTVYYAKNNTIQPNGIMQSESEIPDNQQNQPPQNDGDMKLPEQPQGQQMPENDSAFMQKENKDNNFFGGKTQFSAVCIVIIGALSVVFSACLIYLLMSIKNKKVFVNSDKVIIFVLAAALLSTYLTAGTMVVSNRFVLKNNAPVQEQSAEKDKVTLDESNSVNSDATNLGDCTTDVTITKGGTYEFSGEFTHSIIINAANEDVEIVLNNVKITNSSTAAIIGLSAKTVTINAKDNTENTLSDGGNSEYDGCIFSNAPLVFTGNGTLIVNGNQNEGEGIAAEATDISINSGKYIITSNDDGINAGGDGGTITINGGDIYVNASGDGIDSNKNAVINGGTLFVLGSDVGGDAGIDTDAGYTVNGGTVVALGSDMIEMPKAESSQNTLAFTLDTKIDKDTPVVLKNSSGNEIISFNAPKSFKTVIISTSDLENGSYSLFTSLSASQDYGVFTETKFNADNSVAVSGQSVFDVNQIVTSIGKNR